MRLSLAILFILFGLRFPAAAEPVRVTAASDAVTLKLADRRVVQLDGLIAVAPADDGSRSAADTLAAAALARVIESTVGQSINIEPLTENPDRWDRILADVRTDSSGIWLQQRLLEEELARVGHALLAANSVSK